MVKSPPASAGDLRDRRDTDLGKSLEEEVAILSSILAWRIPWTKEHGGLQSMGLQRVKHNPSDLAQTHWRQTFSSYPHRSDA